MSGNHIDEAEVERKIFRELNKILNKIYLWWWNINNLENYLKLRKYKKRISNNKR